MKAKIVLISTLYGMLALLMLSSSVCGQSRFPDDFTGNWKGVLEWTQTGKTSPQPVNMELSIQPLKDSAGYYSWNLIYGKATEDNRPYILKPVDVSKGHWMIDERNGIQIDQFWVAGQLLGSFKVQHSFIVNKYQLLDGKLHVEFISYAAQPLATTGKGEASSPWVDSYAIKGFQKAILTRQ